MQPRPYISARGGRALVIDPTLVQGSAGGGEQRPAVCRRRSSGVHDRGPTRAEDASGNAPRWGQTQPSAREQAVCSVALEVPATPGTVVVHRAAVVGAQAGTPVVGGTGHDDPPDHTGEELGAAFAHGVPRADLDGVVCRATAGGALEAVERRLVEAARRPGGVDPRVAGGTAPGHAGAGAAEAGPGALSALSAVAGDRRAQGMMG